MQNNPDFCYRSPYDKAFITLYGELAAKPYGPVSALDPSLYYPTEVQPLDYSCNWRRFGKMGGECDCKVKGSCMNEDDEDNVNGNGNGKSVTKAYGYRYRLRYGDEPMPSPDVNPDVVPEPDIIPEPDVNPDVVPEPDVVLDDPCASTGFKVYNYCNYKRRPFCPINTCAPKPCPNNCYNPNEGYGKYWGKSYRSYGSRR